MTQNQTDFSKLSHCSSQRPNKAAFLFTALLYHPDIIQLFNSDARFLYRYVS